MYNLTLGAANPIPFVMVDVDGGEVPGLADTFVVSVSKNGGVFAPSAGAKAEMGSGWYLYTATAGECDTAGPLALTVTGVGAVQQNLVYELAPVADEILDAIEAGLAALGSSPSITVVSAVAGGEVTVYQSDTWRFTVTDALLDLAGYEAIAFVVKMAEGQTDNEALLYVRSDTGLARIDGALPLLAANGTLTKTATSFSVLVALTETTTVDTGTWSWWLKGFDTTPAPDEGLTLATGTFTIKAAGLRAVI